MDVKWIKLSTEIFLNPKMVQLRSQKGGERLCLIWIMLLVLAGRCNRGGRLMLTDEIPYDFKMLSRELGFSQKTLEFAFEEFVRLNMTNCREGVWCVRNWEKYQSVERLEELREYNRIAQRKSRAKKSKNVNDMSMTCQACQDIEGEEDSDSEKELEFHSFCQPAQREFVENRKRSFLQGSLGAGVVMLSNEQLDELLDRLSLEEFDKYVGIVRDQELAGKHYRKKTHYQAILEMATADRGVG